MGRGGAADQMAVAKRKKSADPIYPVPSSSGHTIAELLLYLGLIVSLTMVLFPLLQQIRTTATHDLAQLRLDREWQLFIQQLEREVNEAEWYAVHNGKLELGVNNQLVTYERYGNVVRRRVFGEGHIIMCQYVRYLTWQPINPQLFRLEMTLAHQGKERFRERLLALRTGALSP